jgi:hypothetical protein
MSRGWRSSEDFRLSYTTDLAELMHMMKKVQVKRSDRRDAMGQAKFIMEFFGIAA